MEKKVEKYDVVIIGGGAAGMTAGIYCGRARLKTLIIEKSLVGGLATYTNEIENYPGFPEGSTGIELMNLFQKQAKKFNVDFKLTDVRSVDFTADVKIVETFRVRYEAKAVIVASGGKPRLTNAQGEAEFLFDKGISFCATCDAAANSGKDILVIGSGDAAIEEGMFLTKFARKVYVSVMHDTGKMDCNEIAKAEALHNPKMEFIWNTVVERFEGNERLETVVLKNLKTTEMVPVKVDSCFIFIGYLPNTEIFKDILPMTRGGYLLTNEKMETSIQGVFAAGDVRDKFLKQVATAVGDGAIAGYAVEKYIAESEMFETQILNHGYPSLVYVYNAIDPQSRDHLSLLDRYGTENPEIKVCKVDVYKSDGLAKRLGVTKYPMLVFVNHNRIQGETEIIDEKSLRTIVS
ncbi:MAG TPA: pyridine nucleotide-disulfide oxidoreductase [Erysipelotrichaceae bacterium]|nr:MAG: pyridine nucleotide-disulfide oxidoreductase [Firmicutes bacterium GWE2_51_13]HBZ40879.1 pyridine nucleotide-disulfide oxidoreductase [Erysipelotrichaceae bacterium]